MGNSREILVLPKDETRFHDWDLKKGKNLREERQQLFTRKGGTVGPTIAAIVRAKNVVVHDDGRIERRNLERISAYALGVEEAKLSDTTVERRLPAWAQNVHGGQDAHDSQVKVMEWVSTRVAETPEVNAYDPKGTEAGKTAYRTVWEKCWTGELVSAPYDSKANPLDRTAREYARGWTVASKPPSKSKVLRKTPAMVAAEVSRLITKGDADAEKWWLERTADQRKDLRGRYGIKLTM